MAPAHEAVQPVGPGAAPAGGDDAEGEEQEMPQHRALGQLLRELLGSDITSLDSEEACGRLIDYLRMNKERDDRMVDAMEEDPSLAQLLSDVVLHKRSAHSALARYFGRDFLSVDEDSPEYAEMLDAEVERRDEAMQFAQRKRDYENNLNESMPLIEAFCKERGYDKGEFLDGVWNGIVSPILNGTYTPQVCAALDKALTYDTDVKDAFEAGNVKGRNTNIRQMKEEMGDGLPKGLSGAVESEPPRRTRNPLIEAALKA